MQNKLKILSLFFLIITADEIQENILPSEPSISVLLSEKLLFLTKK